MQHSNIILALTLLLVPLVTISANNSEPRATGLWEPIKNATDPHVVEIANFAINEYNLVTYSKLKFEKVLEAKQQHILGVNYWEKIQALDGTVSGQYVTIVHEIGKIKRLVSFIKI
ncbi:hypothetical protein Droror1_Dr00011608 [Drosera rotundifolia]